ncbi:MAG: hypothetical protein WA160_06430 [Pseudobdellovibrio sp.]
MKKRVFSKITLLVFFLLSTIPAFAFTNKTFSVGFGYYSENFLYKTSQKDDGKTGLLGEPSYPFNFKYDSTLSSDWFISPQLSYSFLTRATPGDTAKITMTHLVFQFGKNVITTGKWDWYVGPGYMQYIIKGAGGTTVMNNGSTTATFAVPGRSSTIRKLSTNLGGSYVFESSRLGVDLIVENLMSSTKRSQSFMLSYAYQFGVN